MNMTELQKKLYDKIILATNYIRGIKEKSSVVKLDKDKIYKNWENGGFIPFPGETNSTADFPIIPMSMQVYAQVHDKDLLGGYIGKNNNQNKDEIK